MNIEMFSLYHNTDSD